MAEYINVGQPLLSDSTNDNFQPLPNLDYKYGPYNSIMQCLSTINRKMRALGLTVGIINGNSIKEYWFKEGIEDNNLVEKLVVDSSDSKQGVDNGAILIQENAPADHNVIWGDISGEGQISPEDYPTFAMLVQEVSRISKLVNQHDFGFKRVIEVAPLTNNTKLDLTDFTKVKPANAEEKEAQPTDTTEDGTVLVQPDFEGYNLPNATSVIVVRVCKNTTIMNAKKDQVLEGEFVYAKEQKKLYLKIDNAYLLINGGGSGGKSSISAEDLDGLDSLGLKSPDESIYRLVVDNSGKLTIYNKNLDTPTTGPTANGIADAGWSYSTTLFLPKLYINSVYCGGDDNAHSYNYCSHNFVELSNLTDNDVNLNGLSLQYSSGANDWKVLPLKGIIKSQSTFLIRGKQCSVLDINTTRIKVTTYDMQWDMAFNDKNAKFYLTYGKDPCPIVNPMSSVNGSLALVNGYIDLAGFATETGGDGIDAYEVTPFKFLAKNRIMVKYFSMDPVKQATKDLSTRNNSVDWHFIDLDKNTIDTVDKYRPMASFENKNIFYDKHLLQNNNPDYNRIVNITFGIQGSATSTVGATRCFTWISKGYQNEFLTYHLNGSTDNPVTIESFKAGDGRSKYTSPQYNRIRVESTDGTAFTVHKVIINNLKAGIYTYSFSGSTYAVSQLTGTFEVKDASQGFNFVQVTDQQGFNADEYKVWGIAAQYIKDNESFDFTMNTGDMTQNGNRMNEWIDYFKARSPLNNYVEMTTVGNNDLCPTDIYTLGSGADNSKINPINMEYFYTYEMDERNLPIFRLDDKDIYVSSLYSFNYGNTHFICLNSEITAITETDVYGLSTGGQIYSKIKDWITKDLELNKDYKWKVCYMHEMPFTIMTRDLFVNYYKANYMANSVNRGGSHLNINSGSLGYWASTFFQNNDVRLVLGGHKHTYCQSHPIEENPLDNMKPVIQVTTDSLLNNFGSTLLVNGDTEDTKNYLYPKEWLASNANSIAKHFCTFKLVDKITAPLYVMNQATGYKHTSNKELPSPDIPWLAPHYFPCVLTSTDLSKVPGQAVNAGQRYPFYIVWKFTDTGIEGTTYKINNIFNSKGKYDVNIISSVDSPVKVLANGDNATNSKDIIKIV